MIRKQGGFPQIRRLSDVVKHGALRIARHPQNHSAFFLARAGSVQHIRPIMKAGASPILSEIRACAAADVPEICAIINDAASAYKGVIPADRWHEPYMPREELEKEIAAGVRFSGYVEKGVLLGVMGIQDVKDVTLIRHAYVRTTARNQGIGGKLLAHLITLTQKPVLIGTWAAATWAIRFYEHHGFRVVSESEKNVLLKKYWTIPDRQVATSVVLVDGKFSVS
jgi:GNAT superfamily N-acetyltransferase